MEWRSPSRPRPSRVTAWARTLTSRICCWGIDDAVPWNANGVLSSSPRVQTKGVDMRSEKIVHAIDFLFPRWKTVRHESPSFLNRTGVRRPKRDDAALERDTRAAAREGAGIHQRHGHVAHKSCRRHARGTAEKPTLVRHVPVSPVQTMCRLRQGSARRRAGPGSVVDPIHYRPPYGRRGHRPRHLPGG